MKLTVPELAKRVQSEADAYAFLEQLRWPDGPRCPHCGNEKAYFLTPKDGKARATRTGSTSQRRVWKCAKCRKQFSVLTGTIFHGSKIPVATWLFVVFEMVASKNGVSAREIERKYGLTPKTAWFMTHRIREGMKRHPGISVLSGTIVADEAYFGGRSQLKHGTMSAQDGSKVIRRKTPVVSLISKETGEVRSRVVPNVTGENIRRVIREQVNMRESILHTDEAQVYDRIGDEFIDHQAVWHSGGEYVRGDVSTNQAENYFSQLKRSIDGTHHHVSREHLQRYLDEFDFRYTTRKLNDTQRVNRLMGQVAGRRLAYRPLAGN